MSSSPQPPKSLAFLVATVRPFALAIDAICASKVLMGRPWDRRALLGEARRILETETIRETIEEAFLEVLRAEARREEIDALRSMDGMDLDDSAVMRGAWR